MSIDPLLDRTYRRGQYNCFHFAAEAWMYLTGDAALCSINKPDFGRSDLNAIFRRFKRVDGPTMAPSVVAMDNIAGEQHIGICLRRRLLHLPEGGVQFFPIEIARSTYRNMRFYQ